MAYNAKRRGTTNFAMDNDSFSGGGRQYNNNRNYNNNNRNNNQGGGDKPQFPKKKDMTFPLVDRFVFTFRKDGNEVELDHDEILGKLQWLSENDVFTTLTQSVIMPRAELTGDENAKGMATIGFITSIDAENNTATITIYGGSVAYIEDMQNAGAKLYLDPKVLIDRDNKFKCFNAFQLVAG